MPLSNRAAPRRPRRCVVMMALLMACLGKPVSADFAGHGGVVRGIAVSPDGSRVMTASFDYTARLWDFGTQVELGTLNGHAGPVNAVAFLPDGARAVSAGDDGVLVVWDLRSGTALRRFEGHAAKIADLAVSPDGETAATASWDGTVGLWNLRRGTGESPDRERRGGQRRRFRARRRRSVHRRQGWPDRRLERDRWQQRPHVSRP